MFSLYFDYLLFSYLGCECRISVLIAPVPGHCMLDTVNQIREAILIDNHNINYAFMEICFNYNPKFTQLTP